LETEILNEIRFRQKIKNRTSLNNSFPSKALPGKVLDFSQFFSEFHKRNFENSQSLLTSLRICHQNWIAYYQNIETNLDIAANLLPQLIFGKVCVSQISFDCMPLDVSLQNTSLKLRFFYIDAHGRIWRMPIFHEFYSVVTINFTITEKNLWVKNSYAF
jgi:hypothetical protein